MSNYANSLLTHLQELASESYKAVSVVRLCGFMCFGGVVLRGGLNGSGASIINAAYAHKKAYATAEALIAEERNGRNCVKLIV